MLLSSLSLLLILPELFVTWMTPIDPHVKLFDSSDRVAGLVLWTRLADNRGSSVQIILDMLDVENGRIEWKREGMKEKRAKQGGMME